MSMSGRYCSISDGMAGVGETALIVDNFGGNFSFYCEIIGLEFLKKIF